VIIRNTDRGRIADNFTEIPAELQPVGQMPGMIINLITREKEKVRIDSFQVFHDIIARNIPAMGLIDGVACKSRHSDNFLIRRIFPDQAFIIGFVLMDHPVGNIPGGIPVFHTKRRRKSGINNFRFSNLFPGLTFPDFQTNFQIIPVSQGIHLGSQFQNAPVHCIQGETDPVFRADLRNGEFLSIYGLYGLQYKHYNQSGRFYFSKHKLSPLFSLVKQLLFPVFHMF
jgi:hypothetical protein